MRVECEVRIDAAEVDDAQRIRVRDLGSRWPFGHQQRDPGVVVVASQKAVVQVELRDQPGQHPFRHLAGGGCDRFDQLPRDSGDESQAVRHSDPSVQARGRCGRSQRADGLPG